MAERRGSKGANSEMVASRERWLVYREKHAGLKVFSCIFAAIYVFFVGLMLIAAGYTGTSITFIAGWSAILLAVFLVVYGFVVSLHHRLMRKHG